MKKLLLLLLITVFIPVGFSLDKVIFNDWVKSGQYISIDNQSYRAIYVRESNNTVIYFPYGLSAVIDTRNTSCSSEWIYAVCQKGIRYEKNGKAIPPEVNDPFIDIFMQLSINMSEIGLIVEREIEKTALFSGEGTQIKTTIRKIGSEDVVNITFYDVFSSDFIIEAVSGCTRSGDRFVWNGDINTSSSAVCIYNVKPIKNLKFENNYSVAYSVLGKSQVKKYKYVFDVSDKPILFNVIYYSMPVMAGGNSSVKIDLTALSNVKVNQVRVNVPDVFKILNYSPDFQLNNNILTFRGADFSTGEKKSFFLDLSTGHVGLYSINTSINYFFNNLAQTLENKALLNYTGEMFSLFLEKRENYSRIRISNPGPEYFSDIELRVDDNPEVFKTSRLLPMNYKEFSFPFISDGKHLIKVKYRSIFGQVINKNYSLEHGESTQSGIDEAGFIEDSETEQVEVPSGAVEKKNETKRESFFSKITIKEEVILVFFGVVISSVIIFVFFTKIKSKLGKSGLDKEIARIQKEEDELTKEEDKKDKMIRV